MGNGLSTGLVRSLIIAASVAASVALLGLILVLLSRGCYARKGQQSDSGTQHLFSMYIPSSERITQADAEKASTWSSAYNK